MYARSVQIGLTLPQGCDREFLGLDAAAAWRRTIEVARSAEDLGFESLWVYDHFTVDPPPEEAIVFDPFVELSVVATETTRARLGHLVLAAAYRNAALTAKMICTLDVVSGGRVELGIGAGWKQDEWEAFGYGFPGAPERLDVLADHLEVISRMLAPGRATYDGRHASARDAINEPKGLQSPRIPILVGGNGPNRTWRLAARFADELNLDALPPAAVAEALPVIHERCREIEREPGSLRVSVHIWGEAAVAPGQARRNRLREYEDLGIDRVILQGFGAVSDSGLLEAIAEDCLSAGSITA
jgi:alkanesulfonate monooxygenase SsuD/methylene tetrahydromethanopterin reductase-like flavin-dependent oxidoreductase (luciferase family)